MDRKQKKGPTTQTTKSSRMPNLVIGPTLDPKIQVHRMVLMPSPYLTICNRGAKNKTDQNLSPWRIQKLIS